MNVPGEGLRSLRAAAARNARSGFVILGFRVLALQNIQLVTQDDDLELGLCLVPAAADEHPENEPK